MSFPSPSPQLSLSFEPGRRIYAVSELNASIRDVLSRDFRNIWVAGEISGCKAAPSGHIYFSLKDPNGQIRCALFRSTARLLKFRPQDGLAILARGTVDVYDLRGEYQLIVDQLTPQGAGALQLAFEELKRKLEGEGLFAADRKQPIPRIPKRIGIVSSPSGAVIRDILNVLGRRFPGLQIRLFPALVQGLGSIEQVCEGIRHFNGADWAEVIIVARGGGSLDDLWTFNEEAVARAIAASTVPVVSAIGHETDFTIADFVADLRAPTPSAAAELVIVTRDSLFEQLRTCEQRAVRAIRYQTLICAKRLEERGIARLQHSTERLLTRQAQRVDDFDFRLQSVSQQLLRARIKRIHQLEQRLAALDLRARFGRANARLNTADSLLVRTAQAHVWKARMRFEELRAHLTQLSPLTVLKRGYAIVRSPNGHVLTSAAETATGSSLRVRLSEGELKVTVDEARISQAGGERSNSPIR